MRFAICVIEPAGYKYSHFLYDVCRYICFSIESAGHECCILRNQFTRDRVNIIVGAHNQTDQAILKKIKEAGNYILAQSEIITGDSVNNWAVQKSFAEVYLPLMRQAKAVWTGIETNVEALKKLGVEAEQILMGYHPRMEEIFHKPNKDIDFLFCGSITEHRRKLLDGLIKRGARVVNMFDDAAMYRNDLIARAKINLAPNQGSDMDHFSGSRIAYLLNNHAVVVVERCRDQAMYEHCFPWAETEQWVDLCMETLQRPDLAQITEEYYESFKKIRMVDLITPLLENFIRNTESPHRAVSPATTDQTSFAKHNSANIAFLQFEHPKAIPGLTSIVILTHNRLEQTKKCVKSIRKHTPEVHEIIFVDNASTDSTVKWLHGQIRENKNYRLMENKENVGVAKGRNQGIVASRGEYILLLDNDVVVSPGCLSGMLACLNHAPDAGIIGPMTNSASGLQQVADESYRSVEYLDKYAAKFKEQYRHRQIDCRNIAGFCMLFKHTLVEKIGLLDERFGTGQFEDEDFCIRAALDDYRNYIAADVFVHHTGGKNLLGSRSIIDKKWTLNTSIPEGRKLMVLKGKELADEFCQKGKLDKSVEALINCIKVTPDSKYIYYELARIFIETKRFSEAWEVFESMPEEAKNDLKGLEYAGYAKEGLGLDDEAAGYAERMLTATIAPTPTLPREGGGSIEETTVGKYPAALNLKGVLAFKKGHKEEAADYFHQAIDANPGYGEAYTNLGVLEWGRDNKEAAFTHLKKGFMLSPGIPDTSSLYYSIVSSLGRFSEAEADFKEACRLNPNHKNLAFLLIDILIQQGKFDAAINKIEDALALFGLDDGSLSAALAVREKIGPPQIEKASRKGTLSLCMIVKNEEKYLAQCLRSVRDIVDEMIIVDTGSTDRTKDIATVFGAKLFDFPWTGDFSAARNHSLAQATGDWILILDADEAISALDHHELKALIRKRSSSPEAYSIVTRNYTKNASIIGWTPNDGKYPEEMHLGWMISEKVRLVPKRKDVFFSNPVHELLEISLKMAKIPVFNCKVIVHHFGKLDLERDTKKGEDYYILGKIKYESDPNNLKYINELAKQAAVLNKSEEAIELWLKLLSLIEADPQSPSYKAIASTSYGNPISEIYTQLAAAYLSLDRCPEALAAAQKAMANKDKRKEYVQIYAQCEIIAGSLGGAYVAIEMLLKETPDYPPALCLMALICCLQGKKVQADELFQLLRQKKIAITNFLNTISKRLYANGKNDEALLMLNSMIENKIDNDETGKLLDEYQKG